MRIEDAMVELLNGNPVARKSWNFERRVQMEEWIFSTGYKGLMGEWQEGDRVFNILVIGDTAIPTGYTANEADKEADDWFIEKWVL